MTILKEYTNVDCQLCMSSEFKIIKKTICGNSVCDIVLKK